MMRTRHEVVAAAESQIGLSEPEPYWLACNVDRPFPPAWCGAFALWSLKRAGLACAWDWQIGRGFLWRLSLTSEPKIGDIAYFAKHQHHAVLSFYYLHALPSHVDLINGNGAGGKVTRSVTRCADVTGFYSIERLLTPSEPPSV
jgi:hypothetical protein